MAQPWFRRKRIGSGVVPVSWQGWLVTLIYALLLAGLLRGLGRLATWEVLGAVAGVTVAFCGLVRGRIEGGWGGR